MVGRTSLDYILSGLKENRSVNELNLSQNMLEDEDLLKISARLATDTKITKLKLSQNNFKDPQPFIELLLANGPTYTALDFSKMPFAA